jgi:hypothetical protein
VLPIVLLSPPFLFFISFLCITFAYIFFHISPIRSLLFPCITSPEINGWARSP